LVKNLTRHCERFFMPAAFEVSDDPALNPQVVKTLRNMPFGLRQMRPKRSSILHESAPVRSRAELNARLFVPTGDARDAARAGDIRAVI
jgi:hypothetical protein